MTGRTDHGTSPDILGFCRKSLRNLQNYVEVSRLGLKDRERGKAAGESSILSGILSRIRFFLMGTEY